MVVYAGNKKYGKGNRTWLGIGNFLLLTALLEATGLERPVWPIF